MEESESFLVISKSFSLISRRPVSPLQSIAVSTKLNGSKTTQRMEFRRFFPPPTNFIRGTYSSHLANDSSLYICMIISKVIIIFKIPLLSPSVLFQPFLSPPFVRSFIYSFTHSSCTYKSSRERVDWAGLQRPLTTTG